MSREIITAYWGACTECAGIMVYTPKSQKLKFGTGVQNYYTCGLCNIKALPSAIDLHPVKEKR